jgi:hypothetical protein
MFRLVSSSGTGTVTFVLPAGSFIVCKLAGLVKANCRPACWANGLRVNKNPTSIGMELTVAFSTPGYVRWMPAALTTTPIAGTLAVRRTCA